MNKEIEKIIIDILIEFNEELQNPLLEKPSLKTKLYGTNGTLDSLALVSFITDVEETISDKFNQDIVLADEKAMSATSSPFRNIESLSKYIQTLLED